MKISTKPIRRSVDFFGSRDIEGLVALPGYRSSQSANSTWQKTVLANSPVHRPSHTDAILPECANRLNLGVAHGASQREQPRIPAGEIGL
jgi:hypothetical protein